MEVSKFHLTMSMDFDNIRWSSLTLEAILLADDALSSMNQKLSARKVWYTFLGIRSYLSKHDFPTRGLFWVNFNLESLPHPTLSLLKVAFLF